MSVDDTNESAFPLAGDAYLDPGMSLRDYFAAKAMHAFLIRSYPITAPDEVVADAAYETADAMMKARGADK